MQAVSNASSFEACALAAFLKQLKVSFFEKLGSGDPCDLRLVLGPQNALPVDGACATLGAALDESLRETNETGTHDAIVVPVLPMSREEFQGSSLAFWFRKWEITEQHLLFRDDVVEVLQLAPTTHQDWPTEKGGTAARIGSTVVSIQPPLPGARGNSPGCPGNIYSSTIAAALLERASELVPAARGSRLFSTGLAVNPTAQDSFSALFPAVLTLLRHAILEATRNLDPVLEDKSWCQADADVVAAIAAVCSNGLGCSDLPRS